MGKGWSKAVEQWAVSSALTAKGKNNIIARLCCAQDKMQLSGFFIDSQEFARTARHAEGQIEVRALARLADVLADDEGVLDWSLDGELAKDALGQEQAWIRVIVSGELHLSCQRCLLPLDFALAVDNRLMLVSSEAEAEEGMLDEDDEALLDGPDLIVAQLEQSALELVEEEILLALPLIARHEACALPQHDDGKAAVSPFAALAKLKH